MKILENEEAGGTLFALEMGILFRTIIFFLFELNRKYESFFDESISKLDTTYTGM